VPKRKPPRSRRKAVRRQSAPPVAVPPIRPTVAPVAVAMPGTAPGAPEPPRERSRPRALTHDYSYVRHEIQRIAVLAAAVFIAIVVLSFFLP
jgi:hypothetical protein